MKKEFGIVPGSPLDELLAKLGRRDRRTVLAWVTAAPGPRRKRLERQAREIVERAGG